ncbi:MAG: hypothetical protein IIY54_00040 [Ruminococcus sp.]|nr:hypothetical protein [Ruminococcus sp.]
MIVKENMEIGGRDFVKQYSDKGFYIERDSAKYSEAIDPADIPREYTETDEPIDSGEEPTVDDALGMLAEMGVDVHD